ncbi:MAG: SAM-dependent methyltransferase [Lacipirellulaceae bacterium]
MDDPLALPRFPRSLAYHPDWVFASASGGANALWLTEWLAEAMDLCPGMRVLDLGCGRAMSSVFLRREFGVQVWAADLWFSPSENWRRLCDAGVSDGVFPLRVEARSLPFAAEFFDAVVSIDSFVYYGTDDLFLMSLARLVKPGGQIGIAGAGLTQEFEGETPEHLREWWTPELGCLHTPDWWRRHWTRSGVVDVELSDAMPDGWRRWRDWQHAFAPDNATEITAVEADAGRHLGYVRTVGRRRAGVPIEEPLVSIPPSYTQQPLLREGAAVRP